MKKIKCLFSGILMTLVIMGCNKYLDKKQDQSLTVPQSLSDLQALLDYNTVMNLASNGQGEVASDNYYLTDAGWAAMSLQGDRNAYIWGDEITYTQLNNEWLAFYQQAYYANTVLGSIGQVTIRPQDSLTANNIKGEALFFRARAFHTLALAWTKVYDSTTAATELGIPIRTGTDFNVISVRATVKETYEQVIQDLKAAIPFLPIQSAHVMRPSKPAAYGLLARVYLSMGDYVDAGKYADSSLRLNSTLLDYNNLVATAAYPIAQFNAEVLFHSSNAPSPVLNTRCKIDSNLYASYASNDLRKTIFFSKNTDNTYAFKGSYFGSANLFFGLAIDEVYLIRAECNARLGNLTSALADLNALMIKRWKTGSFTPFVVNSQSMLLQNILIERRKELLMRDLRWMDIKRLNKEGAGITPTRILSGVTYQLKPNENRYALPIPAYVIGLTGMPQNPR